MWSIVRTWIFPVACLGCGLDSVALCEGCGPFRDEATLFEVAGVPVLAAGEYAGVLQRAILAMKRGERAYLDAFAPLLARVVPPDVTLVPVPTTRARAAARGFDQGLELTRRAAALAGVSWERLLEKRGSAQQGRPRAERLAACGRFRLRADARVPEHAILIDDVCTTGGTIADAIATLRAAGCGVAGAMVLARAPAEPSQLRRGHPIRKSAPSEGVSA